MSLQLPMWLRTFSSSLYDERLTILPSQIIQNTGLILVSITWWERYNHYKLPFWPCGNSFKICLLYTVVKHPLNLIHYYRLHVNQHHMRREISQYISLQLMWNVFSLITFRTSPPPSSRKNYKLAFRYLRPFFLQTSLLTRQLGFGKMSHFIFHLHNKFSSIISVITAKNLIAKFHFYFSTTNLLTSYLFSRTIKSIFTLYITN